MGGITKALLLLVNLLCYNYGYALKRNKVSKRLDDLELDVLTERIERRKSFRTIVNSLENIEGRLNISLAQEGPSGDDIQQIQSQLNEIKEMLEKPKLAEISETFHELRKGFNAEKKQSLRFRRRVSEIEDVFALLSNNSETSTRNILAFFKDLRKTNEGLKETNEGLKEGLKETNEGLKETNEIMKEMYENTSNALLHITDVLDTMTTKIVNVVSSVVETTINKTMAKYSFDIQQKTSPSENISSPSFQESQTKSCVELLRSGHTESGVYSVFLRDHKIKPDGMETRPVASFGVTIVHSMGILSADKTLKCRQLLLNSSSGKFKYQTIDNGVLPAEEQQWVFCDQKTDGGGWVVFQRGQDGSVDFYLDWEQYRNGFGDLHGEFWLGNDNLHRLLSVKSRFELRVDLSDFDDHKVYAKYSQFMVGPENDKFVLTAKGYSGDAGDSLYYHHDQHFSTRDRDNDKKSASSCSQEKKGGWWYNSCARASLNSIYNTDKINKKKQNVYWYDWKSGYHPLKFSEIKFREHDEN